MFEKFFLTHALEFTNDEEHKLIYYEIYQEFHDLFEKQLGIILHDLVVIVIALVVIVILIIIVELVLLIH